MLLDVKRGTTTWSACAKGKKNSRSIKSITFSVMYIAENLYIMENVECLKLIIFK